jgi:MFS family permease
MQGFSVVRQCLRIPAFRRLLAAFALNELAWTTGTLALSVLVYRRTGSAIGSAAFFICSQVAPALLAPAMVARLDRLSPRRALPALYGLEAVLFGVLAWTTHHFSLAAVLTLSLADGAVAATARSLVSAARAEILKPVDLLHEGNAVSNIAFSAAFTAGPVLAGLVVVAGGTIAALLVNCGFFATMAVLLALTRLPDFVAEPGGVLHRLRRGLAQTRSDKVLSRLLVLQFMGLVFFTITIPVEVVYTQHTLHAGADGYGILMGLWGAGAVAGSAIYARWRRRPAWLLICGSGVALAVGFAVMAVAPSLPVALIGAALAGTGNSVEWVSVKTTVQERTPAHLMALMMGLSESISMLAPGIGIVLGGVITALASARLAIGVAAAGSLAFAVAVPIVFRQVSLPPLDAPVPADEEPDEEATWRRPQSLV